MPVTNPNYPKLYDWYRFRELPRDWKAVTRSHEYEDGTATFNELATYAPKRWEIQYTGLTTAQRDVFIAHFNEKKFSNVFNFIDKAGVLHPSTYYEEFETNHEGHKSWYHSVTFTLVQYDATTETTPTGTPLTYGSVAVEYGGIAVNY